MVTVTITTLVLATVGVLFVGGVIVFVGLFMGMGPKSKPRTRPRDRDRSA